jgi:hypothetical protein
MTPRLLLTDAVEKVLRMPANAGSVAAVRVDSEGRRDDGTAAARSGQPFYEFRLEDRILPKAHLLRRMDVFVAVALCDLHKLLLGIPDHLAVIDILLFGSTAKPPYKRWRKSFRRS